MNDGTLSDATHAGKHTQKSYNSGPMAVRQSYMDDEEFDVYPTHGGEVPDHGEWTELATVYSLTKDLADANANARRLAAAWNACEGIPTEALEDGVVRDILEALEDCVSRFVTAFPDAEEYEPIKAARDAIAKATGGAA